MTRQTLVRSLVLVAVLVAVFAAMPRAAAAEEGSWTGWITDASCGAKGANAGHAACARKCHDKGQALVLYNNADQKLYKLSDQEAALANVGDEVVVTGELEDDTITVASIAASGDDEGDADDGADDGGR